jgi:hypothetical protein
MPKYYKKKIKVDPYAWLHETNYEPYARYFGSDKFKSLPPWTQFELFVRHMQNHPNIL